MSPPILSPILTQYKMKNFREKNISPIFRKDIVQFGGEGKGLKIQPYKTIKGKASTNQ